MFTSGYLPGLENLTMTNQQTACKKGRFIRLPLSQPGKSLFPDILSFELSLLHRPEQDDHTGLQAKHETTEKNWPFRMQAGPVTAQEALCEII